MTPPAPIHPDRVRALFDTPAGDGPVVYSMSRDMRARDNWALLHARHAAEAARAPLAVVFTLAPSFLGAPWRAYAFLLEGLREVERDLRSLGIPLVVLHGAGPVDDLCAFAAAHRVGHVVADFSPLRTARARRDEAAGRLGPPGCGSRRSTPTTSSRVIGIASCQEFAARTIRPRIARLLDAFLEPFPSIAPQATPWPAALPAVDWRAAEASLTVDRSVGAVPGIVPGAAAAARVLDAFTSDRLDDYTKRRNDPNADASPARRTCTSGRSRRRGWRWPCGRRAPTRPWWPRSSKSSSSAASWRTTSPVSARLRRRRRPRRGRARRWTRIAATSAKRSTTARTSSARRRMTTCGNACQR
ncbi:MAG: deoxyribodipyrimidine photo-lyase [Anaerolineae bacterium]